MNISIGVNNTTSDYSTKAKRIWRQINGWALGFDFDYSPSDGLVERLQTLKNKGKITAFSYEPKSDTQNYYYVSFDIPIPSEPASLAENGEFAALIEIADIVNEYF